MLPLLVTMVLTGCLFTPDSSVADLATMPQAWYDQCGTFCGFEEAPTGEPEYLGPCYFTVNGEGAYVQWAEVAGSQGEYTESGINAGFSVICPKGVTHTLTIFEQARSTGAYPALSGSIDARPIPVSVEADYRDSYTVTQVTSDQSGVSVSAASGGQQAERIEPYTFILAGASLSGYAPPEQALTDTLEIAPCTPYTITPKTYIFPYAPTPVDSQNLTIEYVDNAVRLRGTIINDDNANQFQGAYVGVGWFAVNDPILNWTLDASHDSEVFVQVCDVRTLEKLPANTFSTQTQVCWTGSNIRTTGVFTRTILGSVIRTGTDHAFYIRVDQANTGAGNVDTARLDLDVLMYFSGGCVLTDTATVPPDISIPGVITPTGGMTGTVQAPPMCTDPNAMPSEDTGYGDEGYGGIVNTHCTMVWDSAAPAEDEALPSMFVSIVNLLLGSEYAYLEVCTTVVHVPLVEEVLPVLPEGTTQALLLALVGLQIGKVLLSTMRSK